MPSSGNAEPVVATEYVDFAATTEDGPPITVGTNALGRLITRLYQEWELNNIAADWGKDAANAFAMGVLTQLGALTRVRVAPGQGPETSSS